MELLRKSMHILKAFNRYQKLRAIFKRDTEKLEGAQRMTTKMSTQHVLEAG